MYSQKRVSPLPTPVGEGATVEIISQLWGQGLPCPRPKYSKTGQRLRNTFRRCPYATIRFSVAPSTLRQWGGVKQTN